MSSKEAFIINEAIKHYQEGNDKQALKLLADQELVKSADAFLLIGEIYENPSSGSGLKRNVKEAINNWLVALRLGSGEAAYQLGMLNSLGNGIKQDSELAISYWKKGLEFGDELSALELATTLIEQNSEIEMALKALCFLLNDDTLASTACFHISRIFLNENSDLFDVEKGIGYLERGCTLGKTTCCLRLAEISWRGTYFNKNSEEALYYIQRAKLCPDNVLTNEISYFEQMIKEQSEL